MRYLFLVLFIFLVSCKNLDIDPKTSIIKKILTTKKK